MSRRRCPAASRLPSMRLTWRWRYARCARQITRSGASPHSRAVARTAGERSELQRRLQAEEDERARRLREQTARPPVGATSGQRPPPIAQPAPPSSQQQQHSSTYVVCVVAGWSRMVAVLTMAVAATALHGGAGSAPSCATFSAAAARSARSLPRSINVQSLWHIWMNLCALQRPGRGANCGRVRAVPQSSRMLLAGRPPYVHSGNPTSTFSCIAPVAYNSGRSAATKARARVPLQAMFSSLHACTPGAAPMRRCLVRVRAQPMTSSHPMTSSQAAAGGRRRRGPAPVTARRRQRAPERRPAKTEGPRTCDRCRVSRCSERVSSLI